MMDKNADKPARDAAAGQGGRQERLAGALRANLRRRKAQTRDRAAEEAAEEVAGRGDGESEA